MRRRVHGSMIVIVAALGVLLSSGCGTTSPTTSAQSTAASTQSSPGSSEKAVAQESAPPGDIPDTQAFVNYNSPAGGYQLDVPEGWARTTNAADATFVQKLDGLKVVVTTAATAPTVESAHTSTVPALEKSGRAVQLVGVQDVQLPAGRAVLVKYTSNSDPDPVTSKQVRLENDSYLFFKNGKLATLTLWAPLGADNVDQWQRIASSFRWQ